MTTSTSFAQMANNQSISLSSALRANTPPTKGQTTSRKFLTLSIFFLLSFFCTTNLWGQTWTRVTTMEQLTSGGTFIMGYEATAKSGTIVPLRSADCDATTSANGYFHTGTTANSSTNSTITMSSVVNTSAYEVYISSPASGKINIQCATSTGNYYGASSGGSSKNTARLYTKGNTTETNLIVEWASEKNNQFKLKTGVSGEYKYLKYNTSSPRFAFYNSAGEKIVFYKKSAPSFIITATSNNNNYGTVTLEGTIIKATPETGYRVSTTNPYSISPSGSATVTQNGNTFTVTPSANTTITINFEAIPTYTVNWHTAVGTVEDEVLEEGATITKPATDPTMNGYVFMGWTEACEVASNGSDFTAITNFGTATEDKDYYAVFAKATTGGGGGSTTGSKTLVSSSSSSYYQSGYITGASGTNNASWTADGFTMVQNKNSSSNAVALNYAEIRVYASHSIVFTPSTGSTITSIVATATTTGYATALGGSSIANCTKSVSGSTVTITPTDGTKAVTLTNTAQSRLKTIVVNYTTSGGVGTTTYDNYITTCAAGDPCASLQAPNVTATATANSITLSWAAVDGAISYNVTLNPGNFSVSTGNNSHTFEGLSPKTTYTWEVEAVSATCSGKGTEGTTTTSVALTPLNAPSNLRETITCAGVSLAWDAISGASKYEYTLNGTSKQIDKSSTSVYISPVTAGKTYTWTVKAIGDGMTYSDSPDAAARTFTSYYSVTYNLNGGSWNPGCENSCAVGGTFEICSTEPSKDGYNFRGWSTADDTEAEYQAGGTINNVSSNITLFAVWEQKKYTITWMANGQEYSKQQEAAYGTTLSVPSAPNAATYACDDKVFVGWSATAISGTTDDEPADLFTTKTAKVEEAATTYYAVFATSGPGGGGAPVETTTTLDFSAQGYENGDVVTSLNQGDVTITLDKGSNSNDTKYFTTGTAVRVYGGGYFTVSVPNESTISKITLVFGSGDGSNAITASTGSYTSGTWTGSASSVKFTVGGSSGHRRIKTVSVTFATTTQGGTSYSDYVTSCVALLDPVLSFAEEPANPIVFTDAACGGNSSKQSVTVVGENLRDVVEVSVTGPYKIARTSSTALKDFTTSLTLDKTAAGAIHSNYQTVYIISTPPAQSTEATTGTLTFTTTKGNTLTVNLSTPTVTCTQYTLTLVDRGVSTEQPTKYYAGETIDEAPADPEGVCTDPIHYVFDGWAEATVAAGATTYAKVTFPHTVTGNTKFYAVYRHTEGNAGSDKFMSVDKEIGELVSGMDYVLTGYYDDNYNDEKLGKEYALSCTTSEQGKYKTKYIEVSESSIKYDEENPYYELMTTDNDIVWTITGDDEDGYSFQNKATGKYLNIKDGSLALNNDEPTKYTIEHYVEYDSESGKYVQYLDVIIQPSDDASNYLSSYYKNSTAGVLFNLHSSSTLQLYLYKRAAATLYTTSPACGPMLEIISGKDVYVTSGYGTGRNTVIAQQTVEYRATRLKTQNGSAGGKAPDVKVAANGVTMGGVVTDKVKVEITQNKELIGDKYTITGTVTVQYTPKANNLQEEIQVQLAVDYNSEAKDNFTVHARSLPEEFVIAAKQGEQWYALNADMSGNDAEKANGYLQVDDIEDPTKATFAPCNTIYTFDGMVDGGNKEYMRFQGIDGKYLWAASEGNTGIQNYAKNTPTAVTTLYNWQLYTNDNETYQLQNEGNGRKLGLNKDLSFGMYSPVSTLQQDIRILPIEAKCIYNYAPTNLKVSVLKSTSVTLTWEPVVGATKYQYSIDAINWIDAGSEPTVTITNLSSTTQYTYYVRAYHEDVDITQECIDYAEISFATTNCDDVPADIYYSSDLTTITVGWTAQSSTTTLILYSDKEAENIVAEKDNNTSNPYTFTGLTRNTTYYVQVFANGNCASPIVEVNTKPVELDIVEWDTDKIFVDINTNESVSVTLENEVSYGSGTGKKAEELFFSKYFEATGNVKLLALYNGTNQDIDLKQYSIKFSNKGKDITSITDVPYEYTVLLSEDIPEDRRTLKAGQELIMISYSNDGSDDKVKITNPDGTTSYVSPSDYEVLACAAENKKESGWDKYVRVTSPALNFSGNDAIALFKNSELIDIIGAGNSNYADMSNVVGKTANNTFMDAAGWYSANGYQITLDNTIGTTQNYALSTNRCLLIRRNDVVSGEDAVTQNTKDFVTLGGQYCEWMGYQIPNKDEACNGFMYVGKYDYSKYYTKFESMGGDLVFDENSRNSDGTITVPISGLNMQSCRNIKITVKDAAGNVLKSQDYKVPIMITTTQGTDGQAFLNLQENLATVEVDGSGNPTGDKTNLTLEQVREICKTCDVVVRDNATLTKVTDGTENDHPQVRNVYVYEGASIVIPNGVDHNYTINGLSLRRKGDVVASAQVQGTGKFVLPADEPVCLDLRVDANNWHWFTLPFDCLIEDVTWVDGTPAKYNTDWFLMYYDGESRAASTNPYDNHWKVYDGTTIEAGKGYIVGITGDLAHPDYTFELRFPMAQDVLTAEKDDKKVAVNAWGVKSDNTPNNKGWNLVGNPYLNYYKTADEYSLEGLPLIYYTNTDPVTGEWYYENSGSVPYVATPIDGGWYEYRQELASVVNMMPFTAYFVQVGDPDIHENGQALNASFEASNRGKKSIVRRAPREVEEIEEPIIVRVELTNSKGESDKTSLVIDDRFTNEYEMNGDFFKWFGDYYNYYTKPVLYTIGADQGKRAFNALNEELAKQPIPMGMYAAQAGNYTFSLNQQFDLSRVEEVWLYDATQSTYTNLMQSDYTFSTSKVNGAGRFSLSVKLAPKVATSIDNVTADKVWATTHTKQVIVNGLENGMHLWLYDATGKLLYNEPTSNYQHTYLVPQTGTYFVSVMKGNAKQTIKVVVE